VKEPGGTQVFASVYGNRVGYQGLRGLGEVGLDQIRYRNYDPGTGRLLSPDPLGYINGPNRYGFCGGDPTNYTDPWGLDYVYADKNGNAWYQAEEYDFLGSFLGSPAKRKGDPLFLGHIRGHEIIMDDGFYMGRTDFDVAVQSVKSQLPTAAGLTDKKAISAFLVHWQREHNREQDRTFTMNRSGGDIDRLAGEILDRSNHANATLMSANC
jgi:RHS repeat-associated protein